MNIQEAARQALANDLVMYRTADEDVRFLNEFIKPTNSYNACIISGLVSSDGHRTAAPRWNPRADELIADDWAVASRDEFADKVSSTGKYIFG